MAISPACHDLGYLLSSCEESELGVFNDVDAAYLFIFLIIAISSVISVRVIVLTKLFFGLSNTG